MTGCRISVLPRILRNQGDRAWLLSKEEISIDFGIVKNSMGLYGQRTISYKDYKINEPISEEIFKGPAKVEKIDPASEEKSFWEANRYVPLSKSESQIYSTIDSLKQIPDFRRKMDAVNASDRRISESW